MKKSCTFIVLSHRESKATLAYFIKTDELFNKRSHLIFWFADYVIYATETKNPYEIENKAFMHVY